MADILSDTLVQAVPDLVLMVRQDGTILSRLGGRELGKYFPHAPARAAQTLEQMCGPDAAQRLRQLVRGCLKGRAPLDRRILLADRCYEVRLRPQGVDRVLMVFRPLSLQDDPGHSQLIETRSHLMQRLSLAAVESQLRERPLAVITIHLEGVCDFKRAFDGAVVEELIVAAAQRLRTFLSRELAAATVDQPPEVECLAPIGDDVLAAAIENAPSRDALRPIVQRVHEALALPFDLSGRSIRLSPAVGVALAPEDSTNPRELLNRARRAMHEAHGRGRAVAFHTDTLRLRALSRIDGEHELRWALEGEQFHMDYRPLHALPDLRLVAFQAAPGWAHPVRGHVASGEFLALAETSELAQEIGRWMLATVCADMKRVPTDAALRAIIGLCRRHSLSEEVIDDVSSAVAATGVPPERLALRITERVLAGPGELRPRLNDLRAAGVQVVAEQFGAGHIAMSHMGELPVDVVSLDSSIVRDLHNDERMRRVCRSAIGVARVFGWKVAAEDVTSRDQLAVLQELGCDLVGGELFGPPRNLHRLLAPCQSRGI